MRGPTRTIVIAWGCLAAFAALLFVLQGFDRWLLRDNAIYLYGGQRLLDGELPYTAIFDHKGPGTQAVTGLFVGLGRLSGLSDLLAARLGFAAVSAAAAIMLAATVRNETGRLATGLLAGLALLSFGTFTRYAAGGPRAKTVVVLAVALTLWLVQKRSYVHAGVMIGLGALVWQPTALLGLPLALVIWLDRRSIMEIVRAGIAAFAPVGFAVIVYAALGHLGTFYQGFLGFNVTDIERDLNITENIRLALIVLERNYTAALPVFAGAGIVMLLLPTPFGRATFATPVTIFAGAYLLLAAAFTAVDIQGPVDLFIALPGTALLAAMLADWMLRQHPRLAPVAIAVVVVLALAHPLETNLRGSYRTIGDQYAEIGRIERLCAPVDLDECVASIGATQLPALAHFRNWTRFGFVINGIDAHIQRTEVGGLAGWLRQLDARSPKLIVMGATNGRYADLIRTHIRRDYVRLEGIGVVSWQLWLRKEAAQTLQPRTSADALTGSGHDPSRYAGSGTPPAATAAVALRLARAGS